MPKVSVIVPTYNVEKYLEECLDSLVNQTLEDIEIVCINDGSTDSTLDILKKYEKKDSRIWIISKENGGPSSARNAGLDNCNGQYCYFMDSDDILKESALDELYRLAVEDDLDLIISKLINFDNESGEYYRTGYYDMEFLRNTVGENVFSYKDLDSSTFFKIAVSPPGKLLKMSLISDIRFPEGLLFEDNPFFYEVLLNAKRAFFYDEYLYERRVRKNSITTTADLRYTQIIEISNMMIDLTKRYGVHDEFREGLFTKILTNIYLRFTQVDDIYKDEFFSMIKKDFSDKKDEYDADETFQNLDERLREIFYSALQSENAREYELSIRCIDLNGIIDKRNEEIDLKKERIREINTQKHQLIRNSQRLSQKLNETSYANRQLRKDLKRYKEDYKDLKEINSQMMASNSWKVTKPIRFVGRKVK